MEETKFKITEKSITKIKKELEDEISDDKLKALMDKNYSKKELYDSLKTLNFTEDEIPIIAKHSKKREAKGIYPLTGIMQCMHCIWPIHSQFRKYRCKKCNEAGRLASVGANTIEKKIRAIVIENFKKFHPVDVDNSDNRQRKIEELLRKKREYINELSDGFYPNPVYVRGAIRAITGSIDNVVEWINDEIWNLEGGLVVFGDYMPLEELEAIEYEKIKALLFSKDHDRINWFYKKSIKVEIDLQKKSGIIYFLLLKTEFLINSYYKFSW